jgi:chromosome partitioning protein
MIIAVVNQKGGCGKSTVATNLAALIAAEGREVLIVDADPEQHSALNWCADRPDHLPRVQAVSMPARNLRKDAPALRRKWDTIVIDGGARLTEHARAAIAAADWLVIPVRPSKADLDATAGFIDLAQADMAERKTLYGGLLLNQVQEGTAVGRAAQQQIDEWQFPVFASYLHSYVAFAEALWQGQSVVEYQPKGKAAADVRAFYAELGAEIRKGAKR